MSGEVRLVGVGDQAWDAVLERVDHDIYHRPAYTEIEAKRIGGRPAALVRSDENPVLVPLVMRGIPGTDLSDAISPYGYPGPLVQSDPAEDEDILEPLRSLGVVSAFVRGHPVLSPGRRLWENHPQLEAVTVGIDLQETEAEIWKSTRSNHRSQISKAVRAGVTMRMSTTSEDIALFSTVYKQTLARLEATDDYDFSIDYLTSIVQDPTLGGSICLVEQEGTVVGGGLFSDSGSIIQYVLGASADGCEKLNPTKFMFNAIRIWGQEHGRTLFHLGGGFSGEDSLLHFKRGFANQEFAYRTWQIVLDSERYSELSACHAEVTENPDTGFFPAYRSPAVAIDSSDD